MLLRLLTFFLLLTSLPADAQFNQLILRKNGISKLRYREGSVITIETTTGLRYTGTIFLLQNDSIFLDGSALRVAEVTAVVKKKKRERTVIPMEKEAFLYANLGIPLFTAGLVISGEPFWNSFLAGAGLVYGPILLYNVKRILFNRSRRFPLGDKYDLQLLDLYRPELVPGKKQ
ncbi:MAG TPA: hypothetical protein PKE63_13315 [Lacibacter sp.]|nr:hypothetical protein [Lacibacter sp.]HMO90452.1 hypothetical protein [Lacibacter sp.]HMP88253.1 hypothetical protein [Lacibacter sp.]